MPVIYLVSKTMSEAPGLESSPRVTWLPRDHLGNLQAVQEQQAMWLNCRLQRACLLPDSHHGFHLRALMPFSRGLQKEAQTLKKFYGGSPENLRFKSKVQKVSLLNLGSSFSVALSAGPQTFEILKELSILAF